MNAADSAEMLSAFVARGARETADVGDADVILVNTCTVREHAEHKAVSYLGRLEKWKAARPGRTIIFAGCAAQPAKIITRPGRAAFHFSSRPR